MNTRMFSQTPLTKKYTLCARQRVARFNLIADLKTSIISMYASVVRAWSELAWRLRRFRLFRERPFQRFAGKVLPCLQTLTNLPSSKFVWLIRKYEDLRPDLPPNVIKEAIPETNLKKWHQHCEILAHEVWEKLCAAIDLHMVYGIAVDAGIDRAKSEHILLSVLYVGPEEYVLPPIYSPSHRAFDGKTVAEQLVFTLQANLGEHRLLKLKFMIADGSSVNHVARNNCEGALKRIYDQISPIGESDTAALQQGISSRVSSIILLSCIGHMLNKICQTTLKPYEESPCFLFKKAFSQSFYSGGRASAAKGKYKGVALDLALARFDQGVLKAEETFRQSYHGLGEDAPVFCRQQLQSTLIGCLEKLKEVSPDMSNSLIATLSCNVTSWYEKHRQLLAQGPKLISALQVARETEGVETPKLGGVTRWCQDKFTCMQFLAKNMDTVSAFVYSESEKARASKSIIKCKRLLDRYGALEIKASCFTFLEQCSVLHSALNKFSDMLGKPMATHVGTTLQLLFEHSESDEAPSRMREALLYHKTRLQKNHNMRFWNDVLWFRPGWIVQFARPCGLLPISVARANNVFDKNADGPSAEQPIFRISSDEWEKYLACLDFSWDPSKFSNEYEWWCGPGVKCSQRFTKLPYTTFGRHPWSTSATPGFPCLDICIAHARPPLLRCCIAPDIRARKLRQARIYDSR